MWRHHIGQSDCGHHLSRAKKIKSGALLEGAQLLYFCLSRETYREERYIGAQDDKIYGRLSAVDWYSVRFTS